MSEPLDLDAIAEREQSATKGPWWAEGTAKSIYAHRPGGRPNGEGLFSCERYFGHDNPNALADAAFVAGARQDIPALLAEVERLRADRDQRDREQRAAAWDLGYRQCLRDRLYGTIDAANPYRADRIEAEQ